MIYRKVTFKEKDFNLMLCVLPFNPYFSVFELEGGIFTGSTGSDQVCAAKTITEYELRSGKI